MMTYRPETTTRAQRNFAAEELRLGGTAPSQRPENSGAFLAVAVLALQKSFRQWLVDMHPSEKAARGAIEKVSALLEKDLEQFQTQGIRANTNAAPGGACDTPEGLTTTS